MDVKNILGGLPNFSFPLQEKNSSEACALTGGFAPLMPAVDLSLLKKKPPSDKKVIWRWLPFKNSARKDDLQLHHWVNSFVSFCEIYVSPLCYLGAWKYCLFHGSQQPHSDVYPYTTQTDCMKCFLGCQNNVPDSQDPQLR